MFSKTLPLIAVLALLGGAAAAETIEVQMLNRGEAGPMQFEPAFVQAQPGDTIVFKATDRGHNSAAIEGMLPEGAEPWKGEINEEISVTVTAEGLYAYQCDPHAPLGMVGLIQVGAPTNLDEVTAAAEDLRGKAKDRMAELLTQVSQDGAAAPADDAAAEAADATAAEGEAAAEDAATPEAEAEQDVQQ